MIDNLPIYVPLGFGLTSLGTLLFCFWTIRASDSRQIRKKAAPLSIGLAIWLLLQAFLALKDIYSSTTDASPPIIMLAGIFPAVLAIVLLFLTRGGQHFVDGLPLKQLACLHVVRIPVEIILYWLFLNKLVPQAITFEGRNFDIFAGVTAPIIAYFGFVKPILGRRVILIWNFICLGLLLNVVVTAMLSAPSPLQSFAFEQPNIAILYFPFSWLPTFIVPVVLFAHLASVRQLIMQRKKDIKK
ncbi:hypothetical protein HNP37_002224 [Flavobacterium nitrogenifigens]|uniref:Uncharacterized protein n=2 Tax=Flavobacterium TaxID=237 RepID=A0A7W7IX03_9FLAO|nr:MULTISPECIES: hypothetical protein [Flavobacterium]MBB4802151.1 hypothetical protein [Flavobacterium nitrogenifigens]MBB6387109.1 hypothetical protein [Flavobacterium notoginsengisoli]